MKKSQQTFVQINVRVSLPPDKFRRVTAGYCSDQGAAKIAAIRLRLGLFECSVIDTRSVFHQ